MPRGRPVKCPYCGSTKSVSKGFRKTTTMGLRKLRKCKDCKRRFTISKEKPKKAIAAK
jgi:transcriptional regulator NrdR family protein